MLHRGRRNLAYRIGGVGAYRILIRRGLRAFVSRIGSDCRGLTTLAHSLRIRNGLNSGVSGHRAWSSSALARGIRFQSTSGPAKGSSGSSSRSSMVKTDIGNNVGPESAPEAALPRLELSEPAPAAAVGGSWLSTNRFRASTACEPSSDRDVTCCSIPAPLLLANPRLQQRLALLRIFGWRGSHLVLPNPRRRQRLALPHSEWSVGV